MRVRLHFSKLTDQRHARRLWHAEPNRPETKQILVSRFTDDTIIVNIPSDHPTVLYTRVLDEDGEPYSKETQYKFVPEVEPVADDAPTLEVKSVAVEDDTKPATVTVSITGAVGGTGGPTVNTTEPANTEASVPATEQIEVRVGTGGTAAPEDTLEVDVVETTQSPNEEVKLTVSVPILPNETEQEVFVRRVDPDSGRKGEWYTQTIQNPDPTLDHKMADDFSNNWAGGTYGQDWGYDTCFDNLGVLEPKECPSVFSDVWPNSVFYDDGLVAPEGDSAWFALDAIFPIIKFTGPQIDQGAVADFTPAIVPVVSSFDRSGKERSIFSDEEQYPMFRLHEREQNNRDEAVRYLREDYDDMNWLSDVCNGAPLRCQHQWSPDGATWYDWKWGQRIRSQFYQFRIFMYSWRGLTVPFLSYWRWWRWRRNRKWEYVVDYDPAVVGDPHLFNIPAEVLTVIDDAAGQGATVNVTVRDTGLAASANVIEHSVNWNRVGSQLQIHVQEKQRGAGAAAAGAWAVTFPRPFGAAPVMDAIPSDPLDFSYIGYTAIGAAGANGYYMYPPGTTGPVPLPGAGPMQWKATGAPVPAALGGTLKLHIEIMGA